MPVAVAAACMLMESRNWTKSHFPEIRGSQAGCLLASCSPLPAPGHPHAALQILFALLGLRLQEQLIRVTCFRNFHVCWGNLNQMYPLQRQISREVAGCRVEAGGVSLPMLGTQLHLTACWRAASTSSLKSSLGTNKFRVPAPDSNLARI